MQKKEIKESSKEYLTKPRARTRYTLKELDERYEDYLTKLLPENQHRGDIVSSNRMLGYCDTVMATCATFLVLPLRNLDKIEDNQLLMEYLDKIKQEIIMYFLGFLIVFSIWQNMNIRSIVIKRVDDFILTLVIFEMLVTTFLPFTLILQGHFHKEQRPIIYTCVLLVILQIIDIGIILYSIFSPKVLHIDLKDWPKADLRELTMIMLFRPLFSLVIIITGLGLSFVDYRASWVFIGFLTLMPTIRKLFWYIRRQMNTFEHNTKDSFLMHFSKGSISKERVETVSDGAVAVVACIIVVDITVEKFPILLNKYTTNIDCTLYELKLDFFRFLGIFCLVSALWYINHTVLHLFKTVDSIMFYFQKAFLAFCCLCPFAASMLFKFSSDSKKNSVGAITYSAIIIFLSSLANSLVLVYGLLSEGKYLYDWASMSHFQNNKRQHWYTWVKVLNIPFWTLICAFGVNVSPSLGIYLLSITIMAVPLSFFFAKLILMNHLGKAAIYFKRTVIRSINSNRNNLKKSKTNGHGLLDPLNASVKVEEDTEL